MNNIGGNVVRNIVGKFKELESVNFYYDCNQGRMYCDKQTSSSNTAEITKTINTSTAINMNNNWNMLFTA